MREDIPQDVMSMHGRGLIEMIYRYAARILRPFQIRQVIRLAAPLDMTVVR